MEPPPAILRPTTRFAYCTGMRRWPSWMNTIAPITASARNGIITLKIASGFVHHAWMPCGSRAVIDAKIISEIPLPRPRWVISSPSHITKTVPVVKASTITKTPPKVKFFTIDVFALPANCLNRNT